MKMLVNDPNLKIKGRLRCRHLHHAGSHSHGVAARVNSVLRSLLRTWSNGNVSVGYWKWKCVYSWFTCNITCISFHTLHSYVSLPEGKRLTKPFESLTFHQAFADAQGWGVHFSAMAATGVHQRPKTSALRSRCQGHLLVSALGTNCGTVFGLEDVWIVSFQKSLIKDVQGYINYI